MTRTFTDTFNDQSIHAALELSKNSWLLAIQSPERAKPSLHPIQGGDAEGLMSKLDAAQERVAKVTGQAPTVTLCYEAGYDGFWLARFLDQRGIACLVMEPASLQGQSPRAPREDGSYRCREYSPYVDRLVPWSTSCLLDGGDPKRRGGGSSPLSSGTRPADP